MRGCGGARVARRLCAAVLLNARNVRQLPAAAAPAARRRRLHAMRVRVAAVRLHEHWVRDEGGARVAVHGLPPAGGRVNAVVYAARGDVARIARARVRVDALRVHALVIALGARGAVVEQGLLAGVRLFAFATGKDVSAVAFARVLVGTRVGACTEWTVIVVTAGNAVAVVNVTARDARSREPRRACAAREPGGGRLHIQALHACPDPQGFRTLCILHEHWTVQYMLNIRGLYSTAQ